MSPRGQSASPTLIRIDGEPDALGRHHFSLFWAGASITNPSPVRAQCFFADPGKYAPHTPLVTLDGESDMEAAIRMLG